MQNVGSSNYSGDLESFSLRASGRSTAAEQSEGDGDEGYNAKGGATGPTNSDYAARANLTNNEPRHRRDH